MKEKKEKIKNPVPHICNVCGGWINPPWKRGDGDYKHCDCKLNPHPQKRNEKD